MNRIPSHCSLPASGMTEEYFSDLLGEVQSSLRTYFMACTRDPHVTEDLFQEATLLLWRKIETWDVSRPFLPWTLGFCRNIAMKHRSRRPHPLQFSESMLEVIEEHLVAQEPVTDPRQDRLDGCLKQLSPKAREVIRLKYEEGAKIDQIAAALGRGQSAIKVALMRAREALKSCMEKHDDI